MLLYKAWCESRTRFTLSAMTITAVCVGAVLFHKDARAAISDEPLAYDAFIWSMIYKSYLREIFVILVILLGVGGLLRERVYGTVGLTLALPVSRWHLVISRATVGLLEVAGLSLLPALLIPTLSPVAHQSYPFLQALQFSLLWAVCGAIFFTLGFLSSVIFGGDYTAPVVSLIALLLYSVFMELPGVEHHLADIHDIMSGAGMSYLRHDTRRLVGPLPWFTLAVILLITFGLIAVAGAVTRRQDY